MNETVNQEANAAENAEPVAEERTFTQAELNNIVKERLERERAKYGDIKQLQEKAAKFDELEEASKTELEKAREKSAALEKELSEIKKAEELRTIREKVAGEYNIPASLLTAEDEEALTEQAKALLTWAKPSEYPKVRDAGEVQGSLKRTPKDAFNEWAKEVLS